MTEWHCQAVKIESITPHPNADNLSIALTTAGMYPVIIKNNQFNVGQIVGYIAIDTLVPDVQEFHFLNSQLEVGKIPEKKRILKAKKIRGIYSQGLIIAIDQKFNEGDSIVQEYGFKKYEPPEEAEAEAKLDAADTLKNGKAEAPPKGWSIPYYDIDGLRKFERLLPKDSEIVIHEKLHGFNGSFVYDEQRLWVKSRNLYKKYVEGTSCSWWDIAIQYNLEEKLKKYPQMVFFGEVYGGIKGFPYDCENKLKVRFFDIFDLTTKKYVDYDRFLEIINSLDLPVVPELYRGLWKDKETMFAFAEGNSTLNPKHIREGFVVKPTKETSCYNGRVQFKLIGEGFNLKK